jgi:hypothetical protein
VDAGAVDAGPFDAGPVDAGTPDAGVEAAQVDAGCLQLGLADGGCVAFSFSRLCALPALTVLQSDVVADSAAAAQIGAALSTACALPLPLRLVNSQDGGVLDPQGAPLVGRDQTLVVAGGSYTQPYVHWLEGGLRAPVVDSTAGVVGSFSTRAGEVLFTEPLVNLGPGYDYFLLEVVRGAPFAPVSVVAYGFYVPGTTAAVWYLVHRVLPAQGSFPGQWYVVRWKDLDANAAPSEGDEFLLLRAGP